MIRSRQYESLQFNDYTIQRFIDGQGERPGESNGDLSLMLLLNLPLMSDFSVSWRI
jgi:hypothetical protein